MLFTDIPVDKLPGIRREFSGPSIDQPVLEIVLCRKQKSVVRAGIGAAFARYIEADVAYFPDNRVVDGFIDNNVNRHPGIAHAIRMRCFFQRHSRSGYLFSGVNRGEAR